MMRTLTILFVRALTLSMNLLYAIVVSRLLGPAIAGQIFVALAVITIAGMVARFGADIHLVKTLPGLAASEKWESFWPLVAAARKLAFRGSLVVSAACVAIALVGALVSPSQLFWHLGILALSVPLLSGAIVDSAVLRSVGRVPRGAIAETGMTQAIAIVLTVVALATISLGPFSASLSYLIASIVTALCARLWARAAAPKAPVGLRSVKMLGTDGADRTSLLHLMASALLSNLLVSAPLLVVGAAGNFYQAGLYNAAMRLNNLVALVPTLQTVSLTPDIARYVSAGDRSGANRLIFRTTVLATIGSVLIVAALFAFPGVVIGFFGPEFSGAYPALAVLAIGQIALTALGQVNPIMSVVGLERESVRALVLCLVVGVPLMAVAARLGGATWTAGAVVATALGYSIWANTAVRRRVGVRCGIV